jgi:U3 small nucleolar ribonucleoprotein protein IMP4
LARLLPPSTDHLNKHNTEGKPLPTELRREEASLRNAIELDDAETGAAPRDAIDDEYARAADADPKVLVTTSRDPSSRLAQFSKEVALVVPGAQRVNRGATVLGELVETARGHDFTDIVVLHEHRGEPGVLCVLCVLWACVLLCRGV